jgi:uncharacterized coiled-coil DUF342 family protein
MKENFSELIEYLDQKFTKLGEEIAQLRGEVGDIKEKMATKVEVNKLLDAVDAYMKQGEDYRQEMLMLAHKVDRHEKWIKQIAEKLGIKLEY